MLGYIKVFALYMIIFTQMLDTSVANLALNNIALDLNISILHSSWIITSFGTGLVISFPLGSLLSRYLSADILVLIGGVAFILTSIACGYAVDDTSFLISRFFQGISSGLAIVAIQPLMLRQLGESNRAFAISLWSSAISLAPVFGPLVGAVVTENYNWRWLFYINVPLVSASILVLLPGLKLEKIAPWKSEKSLLTLLAFAIMVTAMQFVLDFGEQFGWFGSEIVIYASVIACVASLLFFFMNKRDKFLLFDLSIFKDINFFTATAVLTVANATVFSSVVILPLWLKTDYRMPILFAGLVVAVGSGVAAALSPFVGKYLPTKYYGYAAVFSMLVNGVSFFMMSTFTTSSSLEFIAVSRFVAGLALSVMTLPLLALSLSNIEKTALINANSVSLAIRIIASNIFVTVVFISYKHLSIYKELEFISHVDAGTNLRFSLENSVAVFNNIGTDFNSRAMQDIFSIGGVFFVLGFVSLLLLFKFKPRLLSK